MATTKKTARPRKPAVQRPSNINAIATMTIISGALNIVSSLAISFTLVLSLLGLICVPITLLPAVLGIFEILYGVKLLANPAQPVKPSKAIAILEIVIFIYLNVVSGVIGILALTMYTDPEVEAYFKAINK